MMTKDRILIDVGLAGRLWSRANETIGKVMSLDARFRWSRRDADFVRKLECGVYQDWNHGSEMCILDFDNRIE
jgi:hypothetical protein